MKLIAIALLAITLNAQALSVAPEINNLSANVNQFSFDLLQQLDTQQNVVVSPFSLYNALAIAYNGAEGDTAQQIAKVMHYPNDATQLDQSLAQFNQSLIPPIPANGSGDQYEIANLHNTLKLTNTNALWLQQGFEIKPAFRAVTKKYFNSNLQSIDFTHTQQAVTQINQWVAQQTQNQIPHFLSTLAPRTQLAIINTVYFKGFWSEPFDTAKPGDFHLVSGQTIHVPMLQDSNVGNERDYGYAEDANWQVLEIPYAGNIHAAMDVFLPKASINNKILDKQEYNKLIAQISWPKIELSLPKFDFKNQYQQLPNTLQKMGMPLAFTPAADFTGISINKLFIDQVMQQAHITVNENGTEASAATMVGMSMGACAEPKKVVIKQFHADHPFTYVIRLTDNGTILFLGKVINPATP